MFFLSLLLICLPPHLATASTTITIPHLGTLQGRSSEVVVDGAVLRVREFLGIPYAAPPTTSSLRFQHPRPAPPWPGVINVTVLPKACYQPPSRTIPEEAMSEDCLYLNVWAPDVEAPDPSPPLPVLVWVYGGSFVSGSSSQELYDGRVMAGHRHLVLASMQYRLGPLGFLYSQHKQNTGNAGLMDQALAIQWVRRHVSAFGGDPSRVTIFGESAGAVSASLHILSPVTRLHFSRAILQSGTANSHYPPRVTSTSFAANQTFELAQALSCDLSSAASIVTCLELAPAARLVAAQQQLDLVFVSVVDGVFLPRDPFLLLQEGNVSGVDILMGVNENEGDLFLPQYLPDVFSWSQQTINISQPLYAECVKNLSSLNNRPHLNSLQQRALAFYYTNWNDPTSHYSASLGHILGDRRYVCPSVAFALALVSSGANRVFFYQFAHRSSQSSHPPWMGVAHADEIQFVFGVPLRGRDPRYSPAEVLLTKRIMSYWADFAAHGSPNNIGKEPEWQQVSRLGHNYMILSSENPRMVTGSSVRASHCALWSDYLPDLSEGICPPPNPHGDGTTMTPTITVTLLSLCSIIRTLYGYE